MTELVQSSGVTDSLAYVSCKNCLRVGPSMVETAKVAKASKKGSKKGARKR
jgi:hypothetical protein